MLCVELSADQEWNKSETKETERVKTVVGGLGG